MEASLKWSERSENLEAVAFTFYWGKHEIIYVANSDFKLVGGLFVACSCYMAFHMKSIFLAIVSLTNILMSIPITMVIYHYVMKITYFSNPHLSILIIIIGIGADDIFVFHDIWVDSFNVYSDQKSRLNYTFKRS